MIDKRIAHFASLSPSSMRPGLSKIWKALPPTYRELLAETNGFDLEPWSLSFFTGIPYSPDNGYLPSRPDHITSYLGISNEQTEDSNDILAFHKLVGATLFPDGMMVFALTHFGALAFKIGNENDSAVFYTWTHLPSILDAWPDAPLRMPLKIADDFGAFQKMIFSGLDRPSNSADLPAQRIPGQSNQWVRRAAYLNVLAMATGDSSPDLEPFLEEIHAGLFPKDWADEIQEELSNGAKLFIGQDVLANSWILDTMTEACFRCFDGSARAAGAVIAFGRHANIPHLEVIRSLADWPGRTIRKKKQQVPNIEELVRLQQLNALTLAQSAWVIFGNEEDELAPEALDWIITLAKEYLIPIEDLEFVRVHYQQLPLVVPTAQSWREMAAQKLDEWLLQDQTAWIHQRLLALGELLQTT